MCQLLVRLPKARLTWALTQGVASMSISFSFIIHNAACHGGLQDHGDPSHEVGQIWDYKGCLILTIALDSIYLNPHDDVANRSSEGVSQAYTDDSSAYKV